MKYDQLDYQIFGAGVNKKVRREPSIVTGATSGRGPLTTLAWWGSPQRQLRFAEG